MKLKLVQLREFAESLIGKFGSKTLRAEKGFTKMRDDAAAGRVWLDDETWTPYANVAYAQREPAELDPDAKPPTCRWCDRVCGSPAGQAAHERNCSERARVGGAIGDVRAEAVADDVTEAEQVP